MESTDNSIVIQQIFDKPINIVWEAISNPKQMQQWFFEQIEDFKPEIGFKTSFVVTVEDRIYTHLWELTDVIPQKKIVYNWKYLEHQGNANVIFELFEVENKTKLVLTNLGLESFPNNIPEFTHQSCVDGWNYFIKNSLKNYLSQ
ncbi:MAG: ATPase [Lutibacter sp.]|nr:MAG: ATPase [Lutibacter sp.]